MTRPRSANEPLSVLVIAESLRSLGGIERSTLGLSRVMSSQGHRLGLLYGEEGDMSSAWAGAVTEMLGLGDVRLRRRRPARTALRIWRTARFARRFNPDVVYCHSMHQLPLALVAGRVARRPTVMHLRTPPPAATPRNARRLRSVRTAIAVSASTADAWRACFPSWSADVINIPNGIDLQRFRPVTPTTRDESRSALGLDREAFVIGYVGRIDVEKGVEDLVLATAEANRARSWTVVIVGGPTDGSHDYAPRVRRLAGPSVRFLPPRNDVEPIYHASDVVVVPSRSEPFGRVVVEALASGVPVIAAAVGGLQETLGPVRPDLLYRSGDVKALGALLKRAQQGLPNTTPTDLRAIADRYDEVEVADRVLRVLVAAAAR